MKQKKQTFEKYMLALGRRHGLHQVFTDFLEMVVCSLCLGAQEEHYLEVVSRYEKPEAYQMAEALGALTIEMDNHGEGLLDCFGDFFMEHLSNDYNGQFFTPQNLCDMMAQMTYPKGFGTRIADCCVGSGRTLMAAAKINRNAFFYGADNDRKCCLMSVINFCLNGMLGEVAHMNSLSNEFYAGWTIELHPEHGTPYVRCIDADESYIHMKIPERDPEPLPELPNNKPENGQQQLLFNF